MGKTIAEESGQAYFRNKGIKSYGLKFQENNLAVPLHYMILMALRKFFLKLK